jgi:hypothetical protein
MSGPIFECFLHYKPKRGESVDDRHQAVVAAMQRISEPLRWQAQALPTIPDFGEELSASYEVKYAIRSLWLLGSYAYRTETTYLGNDITCDDKMMIALDTAGGDLSYSRMLHEYLPTAILAYQAYLARGFYADYASRFHVMHRAKLEKLRTEKDVDLNGRNNVFSLQPVQFWSAEVCHAALGYGPDEVIRRLKGKVPRVDPLMDGVYVVFSDNPDLTFEEYCAYNDALKPVLGLA